MTRPGSRLSGAEQRGRYQAMATAARSGCGSCVPRRAALSACRHRGVTLGYWQDFEALDEADAAANIEAFRQEVEHARAAVAGKQLDDVVASHGHHPERFGNIRWIYLHMIEECARHVGHADLLRERIDGRVGL
jgi:Protein of unknown function (DUF664)